jgi:hypothetical protein
MRTDKQINLLRQVARHVFDLSPQAPTGRPCDGTLARSGFPDLFERIALPSASTWAKFLRPGMPAADSTSSGESAFPHMCCVCRGPVSRMLPQHPSIVGGWQGAPIAGLELPHCPQHGIVGVARMLAARVDFGAAVPALWLVGRDSDYLSAVQGDLEAGEPLPPWRVFPDADPGSETWQFGHGYTWMRRCWESFWEGAVDEVRADYLRRWEAPQVWQSHLG